MWQVCASMRRPRLILGMLLWGLLAQAQAQSPSPGAQACAAVRDPGERLACYDREAGRVAVPPRAAEAGNTPPADPPAPPPVAAAAVPAAPPAGDPPAPPTRAPPPATRTSGAVLAHVQSVEHGSAGLLVYLDNGDVWQERVPVAGDLSLKAGDPVKISKHLGTWWLSGPHVYDMSVRRR